MTMILKGCREPKTALEPSGFSMELTHGLIAQGFIAKDNGDDRYWERVTSPTGRVAWFELVDNLTFDSVSDGD